MPPPPTPIGAERLSQLTQKESYVFVIALNPSRLFLYPSYFMHCTHCEGVGESCIRSIPVGGEFFHSVDFEGQCIIASTRTEICVHTQKQKLEIQGNIVKKIPTKLYT